MFLCINYSLTGVKIVKHESQFTVGGNPSFVFPPSNSSSFIEVKPQTPG